MFNSYKHNDTIHFWESNYDTLWKIDNDLNVSPKYVIETGMDMMPIKQQTEENIFNFSELSKYDRIQKIQETNRYLFFETVFNKYKHNVFYDKTNEEAHSTRYRSADNKLKFAFFNDIDGGLPFWPSGKVSDDKLFMIMQGYELKEHLAKSGDGSFALNEEKQRKVLEIAENSELTDGPILMIVTLKK